MKKCFKKISLVIVFVLLFNMFPTELIPLIKAAASLKSSYSSDTEYEAALKVEGIPYTTVNKKYKANLSYYNKWNRVIYGSQSNIPSSIQDYASDGTAKYVGYDYSETPYVNPDYPQETTTNKIPEQWNFTTVSGAYNSWSSVKNNDLKTYNYNTPFSPKYGNTTLSASSIGMNKAKLQSPASMLSTGSVYIEHNDGGAKWATFEIPPMVRNFALTGDALPTQTSFTMGSDMNSVSIPISLWAKLAGDGIQAKYIENLTSKVTDISINGGSKISIGGVEVTQSQTLSVNGNGSISINRSQLTSGKNVITINGRISYSSYFNDYSNFTVSHQVIIELSDISNNGNGISITAETNPSETTTGGIQNVSVSATGNVTVLNGKTVSSLQLFCKKQEDGSWTNGHIETTNKATTTDSFSFSVDTQDKEFYQYFNAKLTVIFTDGSTMEANTTVSTFFKAEVIPVVDTNNPPVSILIGKDKVVMGDYYTFSDLSYDPDGDAISHHRDITPLEGTNDRVLDEYSGRLWFSALGNYTIANTVTDPGGLSDTTKLYVRVLPPIPVVNLEKTGTDKVNRKISIDASKSLSGSRFRYTIDWTKTVWEITPITDGLTIDDMKVDGTLTGSTKIDLLPKKAGRYYITCSITNTAGFTSSGSMVLDIVPDVVPYADFYVEKSVVRNPSDGNNATINISDLSYSTDDIIAKRIWLYSFDSNNDGNFDNENWYVLNNSVWTLAASSYDQAKNIDIDNINDGNLTSVAIKSTHVGKYKVELIVKEEFAQETIPKFVTLADRLTDNTFEKKSVLEKQSEIINTAPIADISLSTRTKKKVDLQILTDYTGTKYSDLNTALTTMKSSLFPKNVDMTYSINNTQKDYVLEKVVDYELGIDHDLYLMADGTVKEKTKTRDDLSGGKSQTIYPTVSTLAGINNVKQIAIDTFNTYFPEGSETVLKQQTDYFLLADNSVLAMGSNYIAQCGTSRGSIGEYVASPITILTDVKKIAPVGGGTLFLKNDGTVYCTGYNDGGQLGLYSNITTTAMTKVMTLSNVKDIYTVGSSVFFILNDNTVKVCGYNATGILGTGNRNAVYGPISVPELTGMVKIAGGLRINKLPFGTDYIRFTSLALFSNGTVLGTVDYQDGASNSTPKYSRSITGLSGLNVTDVTTDGENAYFKISDNTTRVAGVYKSYFGVTTGYINGYYTSAVTVPALAGLKKVASKYCFTMNDGSVYVVGANSYYELGLNNTTSPTQLTLHPTLKNVKNVIYDESSPPGISSLLWLLEDGSIYRTGTLVRGSLYAKTYTYYKVPTLETSLTASIKAIDTSVIKANMKPNDNTEKYLLLITDATSIDFNQPFGSYYPYGTINKEFISNVMSNNYAVYAICDPTIYDLKTMSAQESTIRQLVDSSTIEGKFYGAGLFQQALNEIQMKYSNTSTPLTKYVIANEDIVDYATIYDDYEKDIKNADRWLYSHDPTYFENGSGTVSYNGVYLSSPVTLFDKTGLYYVTYQAQDLPISDTSFDNYWLWSIGENQAKLYVHRRPIANYSYTLNGNNITYTDASYDLDHSSKTNKGIVQTEWKWKTISDTTWTIGNLPSTLTTGVTYIVSLRVQDMEDTWSYPCTKVLGIGVEGLNNPPIASFELEKSTMFKGEANKITDFSYDPDGDPIAERKWWITDSSGTTVVANYGNITPDLSTLNVGDYIVNLQVRDTPKTGTTAWSNICTKSLTVIPGNNPPVARFTIKTPLTTDSDIIATDTSYDPDGDPIIARQWCIKYSNGDWIYLDKLPKNLEVLKFYYDGPYTFGLRVQDNPTLRNAQLKPTWSAWSYVTVDVDINIQLSAHTEKVIKVDKAGTHTVKTSTFKLGNGVVVKGTTVGRADKVEAYFSKLERVKIVNGVETILSQKTFSTQAAWMLPSVSLLNPPQQQMDWHTKYTKTEGYEKNLILKQKRYTSGTLTGQFSFTDGSKDYLRTRKQYIQNGNTVIEEDRVIITVIAYRKKADGSYKTSTVNLAITIESAVEIKTEIITE